MVFLNKIEGGGGQMPLLKTPLEIIARYKQLVDDADKSEELILNQLAKESGEKIDVVKDIVEKLEEEPKQKSKGRIVAPSDIGKPEHRAWGEKD